jgi:uncharacterized iron-regulated membrane protein
MSVRKAVFWTHLVAGVVSALVVVMMSVTGVLLTYERQIKEWADQTYYDVAADGRARLSVDELLAALRQQDPDRRVSAIAIHAGTDALPMATQGRRGRTYLDPYTGELLGPGNSEVRGFFSTIMGWHRWFDMTGDDRSTGRAITGAANLIFLYLLLTGLYLWLPPLWRWMIIKQRLFFNPRVNSWKAREYNWHHIFGFWSLIPLILIALSATTISYRWATDAVYALAGEERPVSTRLENSRSLAADIETLSLQSLFEIAARQIENWRRIDVYLPENLAPAITVSIDWGSGGEPAKKITLRLDRINGSIVESTSFADRTPAGKVLGYFRWVHSGEAHGLTGQTVAGVVSALAVLMAWTGVALAYRRLIQPISRRRLLRKAT